MNENEIFIHIKQTKMSQRSAVCVHPNYFWDENATAYPLSPGTCPPGKPDAHCYCDGLRRCSPMGYCYGQARPGHPWLWNAPYKCKKNCDCYPWQYCYKGVCLNPGVVGVVGDGGVVGAVGGVGPQPPCWPQLG